MSQTLIYNMYWLESTINQLSKEIMELDELRQSLINAQNTSDPIYCDNFADIYRDIDKLELSLRKTKQILENIIDDMESTSFRVISEYEEAREKVLHIFD